MLHLCCAAGGFSLRAVWSGIVSPSRSAERMFMKVSLPLLPSHAACDIFVGQAGYRFSLILFSSQAYRKHN